MENWANATLRSIDPLIVLFLGSFVFRAMDHSINRSMGHCGPLFHCSIVRLSPGRFYCQTIGQWNIGPMRHCGLLIHCSIDRPFPQAFYFQNIRPMDH